MAVTVTEDDVTWACRLASRVARSAPASFDGEAESAALLGLAEAAGSYDGRPGNTFRTYAYWRVKGAVRDAMRGELPLGYRRAGDVPPETGPLRRGLAVCGGAADAGRRAELLDALAQAIGGLPRAQREAVVLYHGLDGGPERLLREVAEMLGVKTQAVHISYHRALDRLRRRMAERFPSEAGRDAG